MIIPTNARVVLPQVANILGEANMTTVGVCTSEKINMWARYKPVQSVFSASRPSDWYRRGGDYSIVPVAYGSRAEVVAAIDAKATGYTYLRPLDVASAPCRLGDFRGYDTNATYPIRKDPRVPTVINKEDNTQNQLEIVPWQADGDVFTTSIDGSDFIARSELGSGKMCCLLYNNTVFVREIVAANPMSMDPTSGVTLDLRGSSIGNNYKVYQCLKSSSTEYYMFPDSSPDYFKLVEDAIALYIQGVRQSDGSILCTYSARALIGSQRTLDNVLIMLKKAENIGDYTPTYDVMEWGYSRDPLTTGQPAITFTILHSTGYKETEYALQIEAHSGEDVYRNSVLVEY